MCNVIYFGPAVSDGDGNPSALLPSAFVAKRDHGAFCAVVHVNLCSHVPKRRACAILETSLRLLECQSYLACKRAAGDRYVHVRSAGDGKTRTYVHPEARSLLSFIRKSKRRYLLLARVLEQAHPLPPHVPSGAEVIR